MEKPKKLTHVLRELLVFFLVVCILIGVFNIGQNEWKHRNDPEHIPKIYRDVYLNGIHYLAPNGGGNWINYTMDSLDYSERTDSINYK